jgi:hypothetical protein
MSSGHGGRLNWADASGTTHEETGEMAQAAEAKAPGATSKAQGPAAYFPSIEANYGRTIDEWKALMRATGLSTHKELVAWLKDEHGFGHGHAGAITAHLLAERAAPQTGDDRVAKLFPERKARWRPVYDRLADEISGFGEAGEVGEVKVLPKNTLLGFGTRAQFVMLQPSTPERFDVGLKLPGVEPAGRLEAAGKWNTMMTHRVQVTSPDQVDAELLGWLRQAYDAAAR